MKLKPIVVLALAALALSACVWGPEPGPYYGGGPGYYGGGVYYSGGCCYGGYDRGTWRERR
jgi:hypothetical protein